MTETTTRRPIRGLLYGIPFGLGLMLVAVGQGWAALGTWPPFLILILGIIAGTLWSTLGPAKAARGAGAPGGTGAGGPSDASPGDAQAATP